jgi:hypothetical protein
MNCKCGTPDWRGLRIVVSNDGMPYIGNRSGALLQSTCSIALMTGAKDGYQLESWPVCPLKHNTYANAPDRGDWSERVEAEEPEGLGAAVRAMVEVGVSVLQPPSERGGAECRVSALEVERGKKAGHVRCRSAHPAAALKEREVLVAVAEFDGRLAWAHDASCGRVQPTGRAGAVQASRAST